MSDEKQAIAQNISLLLSQNRSAEARVELERLLALDPEDPESRSMAGDVYAWTGADAAAYKQYNMAADTFNRLGRADKALGVHHKILDLDTSMMDAANQARIRLLTLLVGAEDALVAGQNDKAVAGYSEAIRQFPNHTITYQRLGSLLVRLGRHAEAVEQYLTVGRAFYAHGVLPKARPYFERVLELQADQGEALEAVLACLKAEGKEGEGLRFMKAAVQQALEKGDNESAAAWFERLPEQSRDGATPLGAALLLQSEEVGQAERMVTQLDLSRAEVTDWFKALGRAALERGDSLSADVYFRWGAGQIEAPVPASTPMIAAPVPSEPVAAVAVAPVLPPPPPPGLAPPAPPPGLGLPTPPPGLGAPPMPVPVPVAAPAPVLPPPAPPIAPEPVPAPAVASALPPVDTQDDRAILQTMGEMCLAEEMFEEAKQVFERLSKADPGRNQYWDLLNRARAGLGLAPVAAPGPQQPSPQLPPALVAIAAPEPVAVSAPVAAPAPVAAEAASAAEVPPVIAPPVLQAPVSPPPAPVLIAPPLAPPVLAAVPLAPLALPPSLPAAAPAPALEAPPLPLFAAAESAAAASEPEPEARTFHSEPVEQGRPQIEAIGRRSHSDAKADHHVAHPAVEWGESPYAVGPDTSIAQPSHPVAPPPVEPPIPVAAAIPAPPPPGPPAPVLAPPPLRPPVPAAAAPATPAAPAPSRWAPRPEEKVLALSTAPTGPSKIVHTAFTVQLGELPPAAPSAINSDDEIIE